jgi:TnpA family transposase
VVKAIFTAHLPEIEGENMTACVSASRKFDAWDQNLTTEWHGRYGDRGVMIYCHVSPRGRLTSIALLVRS